MRVRVRVRACVRARARARVAFACRALRSAPTEHAAAAADEGVCVCGGVVGWASCHRALELEAGLVLLVRQHRQHVVHQRQPKLKVELPRHLPAPPQRRLGREERGCRLLPAASCGPAPAAGRIPTNRPRFRGASSAPPQPPSQLLRAEESALVCVGGGGRLGADLAGAVEVAEHLEEDGEPRVGDVALPVLDGPHNGVDEHLQSHTHTHTPTSSSRHKSRLPVHPAPPPPPFPTTTTRAIARGFKDERSWRAGGGSGVPCVCV